MTYHSLAIYYDNQLAENEQKRVPRDNPTEKNDCRIFIIVEFSIVN